MTTMHLTCRTCMGPASRDELARHDGQCLACFTERETNTLDLEPAPETRADLEAA